MLRNIDPSPWGWPSPVNGEQSQSLNPLREAPDPGPMFGGLRVRLATSKQEREAIFRLRYDVLVEELVGGAGHPEADAASRTLRDEWDDNAHHFYVARDGAVIASARVNLSRDGNVELEDLLEVRRFTPFYPDATSFVSRLVVHPAFRGTYLMGKVVRDVYRFHCEQGIAFMFADCRPGLLPIYTRLGMRTYTAGFRHPKYVWVVPLVLVINDIEYLEAMRSPFLPVARRFPASAAGREVLESLYEGSVITGVRSVQTQPDSWNLLKEQILARAGTAGRHSVLTGLTRDESERLLRLGHVVSCRADDVVLAPGEVAPELYVVLGGSFRVFGPPVTGGGGGKFLHMLAEGDVFGGVPFLSRRLHTATVQATQDSTVLVINSRSVKQLTTSTAALAAKLLRNLALMQPCRYATECHPAPWTSPTGTAVPLSTSC